MGRLDDRVAIITGAARGTGEVTARHFVAEGARVLLGDILDEQGESVAKELGAAARYVDPRDVEAIADRVNGNRLLVIGDSIMAGTASRFGGELCDALVPDGWAVQIEAEPLDPGRGQQR